MRATSRLFRIATVLAISSLCIPVLAKPGIDASSRLGGLVAKFRQWANGRPPAYSDKAAAVPFAGTSPFRDEVGRGGMWTQAALNDMSQSEVANGQASLDPFVPSSLANKTVSSLTGTAYSWEGSAGAADGKVNTQNGNKLTSIPLFKWRQRGGFPVDFTLYHNSEGNNNDEFGHNWSWSLKLFVYTGSSTATVHWGNGTCIPYSLPSGGSGTCTAPAGIFDTLVENTGGAYTLTTKDQTVYQFNSSGWCTSITDKNGNAVSLTYNSNNYVTSVADATGRSFSLSYNGANQVTSVTSPASATWTFTYSGSTLTKISWPVLNSVTYTDQFTYDSGYAILTHTDRRANVWTATYGSGEALASEKDPLSNVTSYSYTASSATVTDPLTYTETDNYSSGKLASHVDKATYSDARTYNSNNLVTSHTDNRGKVWNYTWDSSGNMLTKEDPNSNTWTWTYNSKNEPLTEVDPLTHAVFTKTYDSHGNELTSKDALSRTTTFTYDSYGERLTKKTPLGNTTTYTWGPGGCLTGITDPNTNTTTIYNDTMTKGMSQK